MRTHPRPIAGLACAIALALATPAAAETRQYSVQGSNSDGSSYSGSLVMRQDGAATYRVEWLVGGERIRGVAMSAGNILSASYVMGGRPGLVIYQILPDGRLSGQWTLQGAGGVGTETLSPR
jgi:hypothetical protein